MLIANEAAVDHWNGHGWRRTTFGSPTTTLIDRVTTSGPKDVWAFTYNETAKTSTAHHYNGRK